MGNSPSLEKEYLKLLRGLLHSVGVEVTDKNLKILLRHITEKCYWFAYQTKAQMSLREWKQVVKTLRRCHQRGQLMDLKLWTICSSITQALQLLESDSEGGSESAGQEEKIYEEVANEFPPPPEAEAAESDASESDYEEEKGGHPSSETSELIKLLKQALSISAEGRPSLHSAPPLNLCAFPTAVSNPPPPLGPSLSKEGMGPQSFIFGYTGPPADCSAPPKWLEDEPPFVFPITRQRFVANAQYPQGGLNVQYSALQYKILKELKSAVSQYGPQSPFVLGLLDSFASENLLILIDWEAIGKTVLEGSQWLQLQSWWLEEARVQARLNATLNPPGPTEDELTGQGQYSTLAQQAGLRDAALVQIKSIFLRAWQKIEATGKAPPSFVKITQGPTEPYTDFLARLRNAVIKGIGHSEAAQIVLQSLA
ncbi:endogenous retrovirus group K member 113 Gag polyprotein-like [Trichechus inunguis]